jgi:methylated-DNA-[protein]-cysteine S-methyltransferase
MKVEPTIFSTYDCPFGTLVLASTEGKIFSARVMTGDGLFTPDSSWIRVDVEFANAHAQLAAYFAGELQDFSLPLSLAGTPFQEHAWRILRSVPYGTTTTYGEIARTMGRPDASRAVGGAMNRNPITIIVPCHRVVGKNGSLTGYLNGVDMKRSLLSMESEHRAPLLTKIGV